MAKSRMKALTEEDRLARRTRLWPVVLIVVSFGAESFDALCPATNPYSEVTVLFDAIPKGAAAHVRRGNRFINVTMNLGKLDEDGWNFKNWEWKNTFIKAANKFHREVKQ